MIRLLKKSILPVALLCGCVAANAETINGAGASFPAPVYAAWTYTYNKVNPKKDHFNYQSIGSGAGVSQLKSGTIDFAGSDDPVKPADLKKFGLVQFPMLVGGIVPVVNLPGVKSGELKLDGPTLAAIFLGDIKKWNDPAIVKLNPGLRLPNQRITVVRRSDGSGTTWIFTNYLSKVSEKWAKGPGIHRICGIRLRKRGPAFHDPSEKRRWELSPSLRGILRGRGRRSGLEKRAEFPGRTQQPEGSQDLADHRSHLHRPPERPEARHGREALRILQLVLLRRTETGFRHALCPAAG